MQLTPQPPPSFQNDTRGVLRNRHFMNRNEELSNCLHRFTHVCCKSKETIEYRKERLQKVFGRGSGEGESEERVEGEREVTWTGGG